MNPFADYVMIMDPSRKLAFTLGHRASFLISSLIILSALYFIVDIWEMDKRTKIEIISLFFAAALFLFAFKEAYWVYILLSTVLFFALYILLHIDIQYSELCFMITTILIAVPVYLYLLAGFLIYGLKYLILAVVASLIITEILIIVTTLRYKASLEIYIIAPVITAVFFLLFYNIVLETYLVAIIFLAILPIHLLRRTGRFLKPIKINTNTIIKISASIVAVLVISSGLFLASYPNTANLTLESNYYPVSVYNAYPIDYNIALQYAKSKGFEYIFLLYKDGKVMRGLYKNHEIYALTLSNSTFLTFKVSYTNIDVKKISSLVYAYIINVIPYGYIYVEDIKLANILGVINPFVIVYLKTLTNEPLSYALIIDNNLNVYKVSIDEVPIKIYPKLLTREYLNYYRIYRDIIPAGSKLYGILYLEDNMGNAKIIAEANEGVIIINSNIKSGLSKVKKVVYNYVSFKLHLHSSDVIYSVNLYEYRGHLVRIAFIFDKSFKFKYILIVDPNDTSRVLSIKFRAQRRTDLINALYYFFQEKIISPRTLRALGAIPLSRAP